jgi:hypothetical protein
LYNRSLETAYRRDGGRCVRAAKQPKAVDAPRRLSQSVGASVAAPQ